MIPPRSFVRSVYCASPGSSFATSFESIAWSSSSARGPSTSSSPMCETSKTPASVRTARCSAITPSYWTGISQPANGTSRAPGVDVLLDGAACAGAVCTGRDANGTARRAGRRRGWRSGPAAPSSTRGGHRRHVEPCPSARHVEVGASGAASSETSATRESLAARARGGGAGAPKPVAITVTRTSSCWPSSITAPKITFAFWSAALVTTSAASFTSNRPRSARAGDVEQDAGRALDRRLEQRRADGGARGLAGAVLALADADAHQRRAGVAHDRAHVGEVEVDDARAR